MNDWGEPRSQGESGSKVVVWGAKGTGPLAQE